ncbi:phosphatidylinositol-4-phosphate 5-kinase [Cryptosporidium sp. chipmunk genotype I]|uniref:phosphatidylinositol-4-phosphate 5-kinase n=1 Tax=Cryptosporidium sp. chipmunk genotype I TaxID=1280935 RepID=UPI00351A361D|nr:phosphatidylinositol-4-phosphate 5-kinase [Cryptosporidium sp. chipmunk genotype I]
MGGCKSKVDKHIEDREIPQAPELRVEKRPLVELQDKITYEGEWLGDNKHGYGVQKWPDGAIFEGNFVNGTANGYGVFIHTDGDKYEGEWQNDRAHGHGTYTHSDGSKYVGEWKNDKKHGKAIESWVDGSNFEGSYAYGLKQGFGKFSWHDGSKYIGNFDANQINGYGIYYWNDGRVYTGYWLKNHMFGYGKFDWTDHRCYEGQYINDKKDGDGKFTWPDGRAYIGQWKNGKQHGIGIFYNIKKEGKVGEWRDGSRLRWIKSSLENGELVGEGLNLREEYSKQREELLKASDLYENYRKLPKNDMELQQMRILQKFDEYLLTLSDSEKSLESNKQAASNASVNTNRNSVTQLNNKDPVLENGVREAENAGHMQMNTDNLQIEEPKSEQQNFDDSENTAEYKNSCLLEEGHDEQEKPITATLLEENLQISTELVDQGLADDNKDPVTIGVDSISDVLDNCEKKGGALENCGAESSDSKFGSLEVKSCNDADDTQKLEQEIKEVLTENVDSELIANSPTDRDLEDIAKNKGFEDSK